MIMLLLQMLLTYCKTTLSQPLSVMLWIRLGNQCFLLPYSNFRVSIDAEIGVIADWMLKKNAVTWSRIIDSIHARAALRTPELVGKIVTQFDYDRQAILSGSCFTFGVDTSR